MNTICAWCRKEVSVDELIWLSTTFGPIEGQPEYQEEYGYCKYCKEVLEPEPHQSVFYVIDGPSYPEESRPAFWNNNMPMHYEHSHLVYGELPYLYNELQYSDPERYACFVEANVLDSKQLPLAAFPLIGDFEIRLEQSITKYISGKEYTSKVFVWLFSASRGYLTHILNHDHAQDLRQPDFIIPHGDFQKPYADFDQGYHILMFGDEMHVYILAGIWEIHEYHTWFKVEKNRYYRQWELAVQRCRELDDKEHHVLS